MENSFNLSPENNKVERPPLLTEIMTEIGFVETPELEALRGGTFEWREKASELIMDSAGSDSTLRRKLFIAQTLGLAGIYYEQGNVVQYREHIEDASDAAYYGRFDDLFNKIEELK